MKTELKDIIDREFCDEDMYTISYYAYDKVKKKNCILTFSKCDKSSWDYSLEY